MINYLIKITLFEICINIVCNRIIKNTIMYDKEIKKYYKSIKTTNFIYHNCKLIEHIDNEYYRFDCSYYTTILDIDGSDPEIADYLFNINYKRWESFHNGITSKGKIPYSINVHESTQLTIYTEEFHIYTFTA